MCEGWLGKVAQHGRSERVRVAEGGSRGNGKQAIHPMVLKAKMGTEC